MRKSLLTLVAATTLSLPVTVSAQSPSDENGRYQLQRTETGFFRVDRKTGRTSICREKNGDWQCNVVADDILAFNQEIERLNRQIATLENERDQLKQQLAAKNGEARAAVPETKDDKASKISPADKDKIDQAMDQFEYMLRRFMGIVEGFTGDLKEKTAL